jgi:hypothetical protein
MDDIPNEVRHEEGTPKEKFDKERIRALIHGELGAFLGLNEAELQRSDEYLARVEVGSGEELRPLFVQKFLEQARDRSIYDKNSSLLDSIVPAANVVMDTVFINTDIIKPQEVEIAIVHEVIEESIGSDKERVMELLSNLGIDQLAIDTSSISGKPLKHYVARAAETFAACKNGTINHMIQTLKEDRETNAKQSIQMSQEIQEISKVSDENELEITNMVRNKVESLK